MGVVERAEAFFALADTFHILCTFAPYQSQALATFVEVSGASCGCSANNE